MERASEQIVTLLDRMLSVRFRERCEPCVPSNSWSALGTPRNARAVPFGLRYFARVVMAAIYLSAPCAGSNILVAQDLPPDAITEQSGSRTVLLEERFSVSLPYTCGTGLNWQLSKNSPIRELSSKKHCPSRQPLPGSQGYQTFVLLANERGQFTVTWSLQRPGSRPVREVSLRLQVE